MNSTPTIQHDLHVFALLQVPHNMDLLLIGLLQTYNIKDIRPIIERTRDLYHAIQIFMINNMGDKQNHEFPPTMAAHLLDEKKRRILHPMRRIIATL